MKKYKTQFSRRGFLALSGGIIAGDCFMNFPSSTFAESPKNEGEGVTGKDKITGKKDSETEEKKKELAEKAYKIGFEYLSKKAFPGCALCTIAAIQDTLEIRDDTIFKAASGLSGGGGGTGLGNCGGYTGSALVIGQLCGCDRSKSDFKSCIAISSRMTILVTDEFKREYGSVICRDIQIKIFGRYFDFKNKKESEQFKEAGAYEKCGNVVGKAAQFAVKLIIDEGLVRI